MNVTVDYVGHRQDRLSRNGRPQVKLLHRSSRMKDPISILGIAPAASLTQADSHCQPTANPTMLERFIKLSQRRTTPWTEAQAGLTTFAALPSYPNQSLRHASALLRQPLKPIHLRFA